MRVQKGYNVVVVVVVGSREKVYRGKMITGKEEEEKSGFYEVSENERRV